MSDPTYNTGVYIKQGGDQLVVASGGSIKLETGGEIVDNAGASLLASGGLVVADVTATAAELNTMDGITASTAELNIMDGVTVTAAQINLAVKETPQIASGDGAITVKNGLVFITKGSAAALTLADPTNGTDDYKELEIVATTGFAHKVSNAAGSGFNGVGASYDVATATAGLTGIGSAGDGQCLSLIAYGGKWFTKNAGSWGIGAT